MRRVVAAWAPWVFGLALSCSADDPAALGSRHGGGAVDVLVFTRTEGYVHASIPDAVVALEEIGAERGWQVVATDDPSAFTAPGLAVFDVVVFLSTTGDVLDPEHEAALQGFVQAGGGWVGVHSAAGTEYDWPWYGGLLGAYFDSHPAPQTATLHVEDAAHPATSSLPQPWERFDEWYNFQSLPRGVDVLLTIDETSYEGGTMGRFHPMAWAHEYDGGRAFYTAGGHPAEAYADPAFRAHLIGGIEWAATGTPSGGDSQGDGAGPTTGSGPVDGTAGGSGLGDVGGGVSTTGDEPSMTGGGTEPGAEPPGSGSGGCRVGGTPAGAGAWLLLLLCARTRRGRQRP